jgi:hypothetical protein
MTSLCDLYPSIVLLTFYFAIGTRLNGSFPDAYRNSVKSDTVVEWTDSLLDLLLFLPTQPSVSETF